MSTPLNTLKGAEKILLALAAFDYLTAEQVTRLCYSPGSLSHVRKQLKLLAADNLLVSLAGRSVILPSVYTLSAKGSKAAALLGMQQDRRVRPAEEREKAQNLFFLKHTIAVTDVLIGARLLAQTYPSITLTRMYTERQLKRKIYVSIPEPIRTGPRQHRIVCLEPDASVLFRITESWHEKPETWEDSFFIEVYRNLPPVEWRFKQKIQGYVATVDTRRHEALFQTPALSIAVIAATEQITTTLKRWTEEALHAMARPEEGERFFFRTIDTAMASPEEMYLAPSWEQAFGTAKTPLICWNDKMALLCYVELCYVEEERCRILQPCQYQKRSCRQLPGGRVVICMNTVPTSQTCQKVRQAG
jgi:hypothetical protein